MKKQFFSIFCLLIIGSCFYKFYIKTDSRSLFSQKFENEQSLIQTQQPRFLNLSICLLRTSSGLSDPVVKGVVQLLYSKSCPIIIDTHLADNIIKLSRGEINFVVEDWAIYQKDHFFLLIPINYLDKKIEELDALYSDELLDKLMNQYQCSKKECAIGLRIDHDDIKKIKTEKQFKDAVEPLVAKHKSHVNALHRIGHSGSFKLGSPEEIIPLFFVTNGQSSTGEWNIIFFGHGWATKKEIVQSEPIEMNKKDWEAEIAALNLYEIEIIFRFFSEKLNICSILLQSCFANGYHNQLISHMMQKIKSSNHNFVIITNGVFDEPIQWTKTLEGEKVGQKFTTYFNDLASLFKPILENVYKQADKNQAAVFDNLVESKISQLAYIVEGLGKKDISKLSNKRKSCFIIGIYLSKLKSFTYKFPDDYLVIDNEFVHNFNEKELDINKNIKRVVFKVQFVPFVLNFTGAYGKSDLPFIISMPSRNPMHLLEGITIRGDEFSDSEILSSLFLRTEDIYTKLFYIKNFSKLSHSDTNLKDIWIKKENNSLEMVYKKSDFYRYTKIDDVLVEDPLGGPPVSFGYFEVSQDEDITADEYNSKVKQFKFATILKH